jgi:hypothetical protein
MKAVACLIGLCLLAGLVTADYAWEQGKQYRYKVRGRVMAGISEINTQYAGLQLEYTQVVTVGSNGVINVKTEELRAIEVNEELDGGWRDGQITKGQEASIPSELKHYLTCPMDMIVKRGVVQSIKVPSDLPTWAVNIKKAMASVFTLDTTGMNKVVEGNLNRKTNAVRTEEANQESGFFYEVLEQSVHGECEVYYTVSQNGPFNSPFQFEKQAQAGTGSGSGSSSSSSSESAEYQGKRQSQNRIYKAYQAARGASSSSSSSESSEESSKEQAWPRAFKQLCDENDQIYEVIKTVNFTACAQKPTLAYTSPSELNFRPADNAGGSLWGRALVSRYLACGTSRQNYTILQITQQERFHTGLQDLEKVVAGAQKNVTLVSITQGHPTPVPNPKTINNLVYTFDPKEQEMQKDGRIQQASTQSDSDSSSESQERGQRRGSNSQEYQQDAAYLNRQQKKQQQKRQQQKQQSSSSSSSSSSSEENRRQGRQGKKQSSSSSSSSSSSEEIYRSGRQAYKTAAEGKGQLPQPSLDQAPLSSMLITPLKRTQMKQRVHELMKEIVQDLTKSTEKDSIAERETLSKISTVVKILRVLNTSGIEEVAQKWTQSGNEQQEVGRSIFLDALSIAGTNPCVVYLLKQIKAGHLNGEEAAQILATLPMYIRTPTKELLEKYFELIEQETVKRQEQVRTTAMLSFSTLLYNACINKRVKNSRYPVALYGEFCSEEYVARKYVPYFIQRLEKRLESESESDKHWIVTLLTVLGNLGHPDTIEIVQKIMDEETDPFIKVKAIYALKNLIQSRSNLNQNQRQQQKEIISVDRMSLDLLTDEVVEQQVLPVLVSVAFDRGEHPEVRNAAFSLLFHCTYADVAIWQQAALATWFEPSRDVRSYIYSTLKSLANLDRPLKGAKWVMQRKARAVLPMAKPIDASIARSHNLFADKFFEQVNSGFAQHLSYFESQDSLFPNHIYYRNFFQFGNGAAGVHPVEFSVAGNTIQKLATAFVEAVTSEQSKDQMKGHKDLHEIKNLLNIEPREQDEPVLGSIYLKLRDEIERLWTFDQESIEKLAQQLAQGANAQGQINVNYQKAVHMAEHLASMPTIMGFPLVYHMRMPALVSIRGTIKLENQRGTPEITLQADLSPVYAWKIHRQLSFKCPFTGKNYQSGVQRHVVVEAPFTLVARKAPRGQLQLAITPAHLSKGAPSGTINLATYHQIPYTAIITDEFYPTIHPQGGKMQIVHANEDEKKNYQQTRTFGQEMFGLHFQVKEQSEFPEEQENVSGWARFIRQFHTANCAFNAAWLGSPSIRYAKREIILDLDKSETNTLVFLLAARTQSLSVSRQLRSSEESDSSSSSESNGVSGSSSSSSSSSESEEGNQWFRDVQSPRSKQQYQQYKQQQQQQKQQKRQQQKQQQQQQRGQSQSQSGSSSSSSESSESQSASFENQSQRTRGHTVILALLGKKAPLASLDELKSSVQKPLQKGSQTTVQYLLHIAQNPQNGKLFVRASIGDACNQAAEALPQSSQSFQAIREAIVDAPNSQKQPKYCMEFQGTMDTPKKASRHIVAVRRETLLAQDLTVKVDGKFQFGQTCRLMPLYVKIQGKLHRDQEMTEWARSKSPQAQQCDEDKKKGFSISQICMDVSEQQAAALNEWHFVVEHSSMPKQVQNATVHIQNVLKAVFFPQLSENQYPESNSVRQGTFELWGRMTADKQFVSFHIRKPDSVLTFNDIKTNAIAKALLPPTATQTMYGNVKDRLFRAQSDPMCAIEKNYVNTFDNVTYTFNQQTVRGCQHVLAKDCSGRYPMAVLIKNLDQDSNRAVTVLLGEIKIKIQPSGSSSHLSGLKNRIFGGRQQEGSSGMTVLVNGQEQKLPVTIKSQEQGQKRPIAEVMEMPNGGIQVIGRHIQVATDGQRVIVYGNNVFRNRTCGICGDFNNEKVADMRSPKDFPLSSGTLLVASYAFNPLDGSQQCQVDKQVERQIRKEEEQGEQEDRYVSNVHQRGKNYGAQQEQRRQQQQQQRKQQEKKQRGFFARLFGKKSASSSSSSSSSSEETQQNVHKHQQNKQQQQHKQQQKQQQKQQKKQQQQYRRQQDQSQSQESESQERRHSLKQQQKQQKKQQQQQQHRQQQQSQSQESESQERRHSLKQQQQQQKQQKKQQQQQQQQQQHRQQQQSQSQESESQERRHSLKQQQQQQKQQQGQTGWQQQPSPVRSQESSSSSESNSQERQQQQQHGQHGSIVFEQKVMRHPTKSNEICFSLNKLPTCAQGYDAKKMSQKPTTFHCMQKGQQAENIKEQIQQGQHYDLSRKQHEQLRTSIPRQCVRA